MACSSQADLDDVFATWDQTEAAVESRYLVDLGQGDAQLLGNPSKHFLREVPVGFLNILKNGDEIVLTVFVLLEQRFHFLHIN
jgi:hypothetical protein